MSKLDIIVLSGEIGSGKTTVSNILVNDYNYVSFAFADPLKQMLSILYNWPLNMLNGETEELRKVRESKDEMWSECLKRDVIPRRELENFSDVCKAFTDKNIFITNLLNRIYDEIKEGKKIVISDCRFPNEFAKLRDLFKDRITFVRITKPGTPITVDPASHPSRYSYLNERYDLLLHNEKKDIETLKISVGKIMDDKRLIDNLEKIYRNCDILEITRTQTYPELFCVVRFPNNRVKKIHNTTEIVQLLRQKLKNFLIDERSILEQIFNNNGYTEPLKTLKKGQYFIKQNINDEIVLQICDFNTGLISDINGYYEYDECNTDIINIGNAKPILPLKLPHKHTAQLYLDVFRGKTMNNTVEVDTDTTHLMLELCSVLIPDKIIVLNESDFSDSIIDSIFKSHENEIYAVFTIPEYLLNKNLKNRKVIVLHPEQMQNYNDGHISSPEIFITFLYTVLSSVEYC